MPNIFDQQCKPQLGKTSITFLIFHMYIPPRLISKNCHLKILNSFKIHI